MTKGDYYPVLDLYLETMEVCCQEDQSFGGYDWLYLDESAGWRKLPDGFTEEGANSIIKRHDLTYAIVIDIHDLKRELIKWAVNK